MTVALCGAKKKQGGTCGLTAGWGTKHPGVGRCRKHGGNTRNHVAAARKAQAEAEASRMVASAGVDQHPIEHLLESLHRAAALVEVWGSMVAAIDDKAEEEAAGEGGHLRGELGYEEVTGENYSEVVVLPKDRLMAVNSKGEARVHPYVVEYQQALERRAKFAKLCLDAGIAERQVRIAEEQGELLARAIRGILEDLGVADRKEAPAVVRKHLSLVSSAA